VQAVAQGHGPREGAKQHRTRRMLGEAAERSAMLVVQRASGPTRSRALYQGLPARIRRSSRCDIRDQTLGRC